MKTTNLVKVVKKNNKIPKQNVYNIFYIGYWIDLDIFYRLYSGVSFLTAVLIYFLLPETKGKSLSEIEEIFGWSELSGKTFNFNQEILILESLKISKVNKYIVYILFYIFLTIRYTTYLLFQSDSTHLLRSMTWPGTRRKIKTMI